MEPKIVLSPMAEVDSGILEVLERSLAAAFGCPVTVENKIGSLDYAYDRQRKQYLAPRLLSTLRSFSMEPGDRRLGIVDVDLYTPELSFIFGEADIGSGVAVISLYRLRQERYGLPGDEELFHGRAIKEAVHELGHTYYLGHCRDVRCVMHFSNCLADTDVKGRGFCPKCQQKLKETKADATAATDGSGVAPTEGLS